MRFELSDLSTLSASAFDTIIDVRAPAEFAADRVPGAINLPVLDDAERAEVGTLYTRVDRFLARKRGAALVARNAAAHLETALRDKPGGWRPLVYCWRGGQRSGSFASILEQIGWRVAVLEGGYRSYRRLIVRAMHDDVLPYRLILLDGNTGTAKTAFLARLASRGHQVLDLEAAASHRGSVFGSRGPQPSQRAFEGQLAVRLQGFDPARPVVVEAESSKIGYVQIPPSLWAAMRAAPRLRLAVPRDARARYLVRAYADIAADAQGLHETLEALRPIQGKAQVARWQALALEGALESLAIELMEAHYDPRYAKARARGSETGTVVELTDLDEPGLEQGVRRIEEALRALG